MPLLDELMGKSLEDVERCEARALAETKSAVDLLKELYPEVNFEVHTKHVRITLAGPNGHLITHNSR